MKKSATLTKNILGICGSPLGVRNIPFKHKDGIDVFGNRDESTCAKLLKRALREAEKSGVRTKILDLANDDTPPMNDSRIKDMLRKADGFIIATPVHWFNVSVLIKQFIDEALYDFSNEPYELEGKPVGIIAVCNEDGGNQAISNIAMPLNHCGVFVPPFGTLFYNRSMPEHGEGGWQEEVEWIGKVVVDYIIN